MSPCACTCTPVFEPPSQFMIPLGIAIACATLIGNLLGADDATSARKVAVFGVCATVLVSAVYGVCAFAFRRMIPQVGVVAVATDCSCPLTLPLHGRLDLYVHVLWSLLLTDARFSRMSPP